jgi:alpha-methylacyl-CoA racemase
VLLTGVKVVDFTPLLPGPYASLRLADLGAEVVKVEPPGGDPARYIGLNSAGAGVVFLANNRNKTSVVLDLKAASGQSEAMALVESADVVLEGFRPGVADRLGIGYEAVRRVNPRIVYCSLTGYGQTSPLADMAGHDLNYMATSGMLAQFRDAEGRPVVPKVQLADLLGGVVASEAILAALLHRERTGEGRYLDVAMTDALMGLLTMHALIDAVNGYPWGVQELGGGLICYNLYRTRDGRMVSLGALEPKFWEAFCAGVKRPDWVQAQFTPATLENPVFREVTDLFAQRSLAEWTQFGQQVDCCLQPVLEVNEAFASDYAKARGMVWDAETPTWGTLRQVHTHAGGSREPGQRPRCSEPPRLDSHREVTKLDVTQS